MTEYKKKEQKQRKWEHCAEAAIHGTIFHNSRSEPAEEICLGMDKTIAGLENLKTKLTKCCRKCIVPQRREVGKEVDILRTGGVDVGVKKANGCQAELDSASSALQFHSWDGNTRVYLFSSRNCLIGKPVM